MEMLQTNPYERVVDMYLVLSENRYASVHSQLRRKRGIRMDLAEAGCKGLSLVSDMSC